jgi:3alpha(or 20beta)-hydroxysteroid dehydrogenase
MKRAFMGRLDGKVALITGGARGMGKSHVRHFVAEGARVVLGDVLDDKGAYVAAKLGEHACRYVHHDVTSEADWESAVALATGAFGKLDVLVNNAGVLSFGTVTHELAVADYRRVIEINQFGTFLGMRAAIPAMLRHRGGSIVNISSTNGFRGVAGTVAYGASKFAIRGMTKTVALEYGMANIRVNSVHPGAIDTPMTQLGNLGGMSGDEQTSMVGAVALGRFGQPEEVANLALFLASDESSYCTGAEFIVDGGMLAGQVNPRARPRLDP